MFTVPGLYHLRYGAGRGTEVRGGAAGQETWWYLQWGPGYGEVSRLVGLVERVRGCVNAKGLLLNVQY